MLVHLFKSFLFQTDKPAIEELHQFLEFQLPRQWAPMYGDLPLVFDHKYKRNASPSLQFTLMGPKLYVNTVKVIRSSKFKYSLIVIRHLKTCPNFTYALITCDRITKNNNMNIVFKIKQSTIRLYVTELLKTLHIFIEKLVM
jgi:hypothetical protein